MDPIVNIHSVSYLRRPYLIWPRDLYIVAALKTMKQNGLRRAVSYSRTICIKRTWREGDQTVERKVDPEDIQKIHRPERRLGADVPRATRLGAPGRIGTARIIKEFRPIVVPSGCRARRHST
jgi:hypothetical protein